MNLNRMDCQEVPVILWCPYHAKQQKHSWVMSASLINSHSPYVTCVSFHYLDGLNWVVHVSIYDEPDLTNYCPTLGVQTMQHSQPEKVFLNTILHI